MNKFETRHQVIDKETKELPDQALLVTAHHDDEKMLNLQRHLRRRGVGLTIVSLTDSNYEGIGDTRWLEAVASGEEARIAELHRIGVPDGSLEKHVEQALEFAGQYTEGRKAVFAPSDKDEHDDHRAAFLVASQLGMPLWTTDTLTGRDRKNNLLVPDMYIPLSTRTARAEKRFYEQHTSQTKGIPQEKRPDMFNALGMTRRRGMEIGVAHAAVLFEKSKVANPVREWVQRRPIS